MESTKYKTILTKDGYLLSKKKFTNRELEMIKDDLTVQPQLSYSIGVKNKIDKFEVYKENDEYISVPKFYGINKLGQPEFNDEIVGEKVSFNFKGNLRPLQQDIVTTVHNHMKKNDGGGICVGCGGGKTVMGMYLSFFT